MKANKTQLAARPGNLHLHSYLLQARLTCQMGQRSLTNKTKPPASLSQPLSYAVYSLLQAIEHIASALIIQNTHKAKITKSIWAYKPYRATLLRNDRHFALVTPDGKQALRPESIKVLLDALNK